ncbi:hypothetical protein GXW74_08370 [Roseomonas eburnea]|uniref:Uncharacterized protein n=1 Tax=Neoroseomonas eburnea TaxID=1346889 RepID=A0A9X9X9W3_9PROT|nr:hypothetical protein [Neoroseomonas eburnea]MBR0680499.1 hypothetical protein [Neoroseomonas eburnea]
MAEWKPPAGTGPRWILACVAGLAVGLPLATLWGVTLRPDMLPGTSRVGLLIMALRALSGAILGGCLGLAQAWALRRVHPDLPPLRWIGATAAAGYLAALIGMSVYGVLIARFDGFQTSVFLVAAPLATGLLGGLIHGLAQGLVLDGVVRRWVPWVWLNVLGWVLAAGISGLRSVLGLAGTEPLALVGGSVIVGALEGLAIGLVTAGAIRLMPAGRPAEAA